MRLRSSITTPVFTLTPYLDSYRGQLILCDSMSINSIKPENEYTVPRYSSFTAKTNYPYKRERSEMLQTTVKKWFRDKCSGFLDNGSGQDIAVTKSDLVNCEFLKVGVMVEFECHSDKRGLVAKS